MLSRRLPYMFAALALIAVGLLTRLPVLTLPWAVAKPLGSVLWGAMVFCLVRFCWPRLRVSASAIMSAAIAAAVEFSQLWHAPWLDAFRRTTIGVLLIGRYFAWEDFVAYLLGIVAMCFVEIATKAFRTSRLESL